MATVNAQLTTISLADATTGWSGTSGGLDIEVYKQAVSIGSDGAFTYQTGKNTIEECTYTPGTNLNMTANYTNPHIYFTMRCDVFPFSEDFNTGQTNSGLMLRVIDGNGSNNFKQWHLAGADTWDGSWRTFVLDLSGIPSHSGQQQLDLSNVDVIRFTTDNTNSGTIRVIDNTWLDAVRYGDGLQIESTTTEAVNFQDMADADALTANYYGVLRGVDGVLFCQGGLVLGDDAGSADCNFVSSGENLFFPDRPVGSGHYKIEAVEGTGQTDIDISNFVCKTVGGSGAKLEFSATDITSFSLDDSTCIDMGSMSFYVGSMTGTKFIGCGQTDLGVSTFTATNCSWSQCDQIIQNGATLEACVIDDTSAQEGDGTNNTITFVAAGTSAGGSGSATCPMPSGLQDDDYVIIVANAEGTQGIDWPGDGWDIIDSALPNSAGTADSTSANLGVFGKHVLSTQGSVPFGDFGDHTLVQAFAFRNVDKNSPIDAITLSTNATGTTSHTVTGTTTVEDGAMVVVVNSFGIQSGGASAWTNSNLVSITEAIDSSLNAGSDGAISAAYGIKTTAGVVGNTTLTTGSSVLRSSAVFSLTPSQDLIDAAAILSDDPADLDNCTFISSSTGHAIELTTACAGNTYSLTGHDYQGYAATDGSTGNEVIYNNSGGAVTLNISGGDTPTIRNGTSASTTVNATVSFSLSNVISGTTLYVEALSGGSLSVGTVMIAATTVSVDPYTTNLTANQPFRCILANASGATKYEPIIFDDNTSSGFSRRIEQTEDA